MREPNFGEGQLQQSINSSIQFDVFRRLGIRITAKVPTLPREFRLGWDTGFHFNWLPFPHLSKHDGCNFFIQYKLSKELTTSGAAQYHCWNCSYMRFRIPYRNRREEDFSQWDRLKEIADLGYPTFYCTNSVLDLSELEYLEESGALLNETPFLDVRQIGGLHIYATFTRDSSHFILHSEHEKVKGIRWKTLQEGLLHEKRTTLEDGNKKLYKTLVMLGERSKSKSLSSILSQYPVVPEQASKKEKHFLFEHQFYFLQWAYQKLFGLILHRFILNLTI